MTSDIAERVRALYEAVDARVAAAGPVCEASGRCCRFREYGHTLFLSAVEAGVLLDAMPGYERPVSADGCPFQIDGLCTARDARPLGCRIYFCDPTYQEESHRITEFALGELKKLADEHGLGWRYAPLHVMLNEADTGTAAPENRPDRNRPDRNRPDRGGRLALPIASDPHEEER